MGDGKLNLFAIGQAGVNVVKSPIQLTDDECTSAQNAIHAPAAEGGPQKRGGLARRNASALNGGADILAIASVPLPNPFNSSTLVRAYLYLNGAPNLNWVRSADGTTWVEVSIPEVASILRTTGMGVDSGLATIQPVPGLLLYLSSQNQFSAFDGTSDQIVLTVPSTVDPTLPLEMYTGSGYHAGSYYVASIETGTNLSAVYKFDITTGQLTLIAAVFAAGDGVTAVVSYVGRLFAAASDLSSGAAPNCFVYQCDPASATAWTIDSANLSGPVVSMVNYKGNLYLATSTRNAAVPMRIYKRTPSGVYSTVYTDATPWNIASGGPMIVFNNTLFAFIGGNIVKSTDGTTWTTDLDVYTTYGSLQYRSGMPVLFNNELYWAFREVTGTETNSRVLKRTTGGVWSVVYGPAQISTAALTVFEVP